MTFLPGVLETLTRSGLEFYRGVLLLFMRLHYYLDTGIEYLELNRQWANSEIGKSISHTSTVSWSIH